jgi:hypothetical protein
MKRSTIDGMVRAADPLREDDVRAWLMSPAAEEARSAPVRRAQSPDLAQAARGRRRLPALAAVAAVVVVLGAAAGAASVLLGRPAPPRVKEDLRGVDAGFPADLRYNPDVENARSVAATADSTLYYAELKDGGHCAEIVTSGIARGAVCTTAAQLGLEPIEVTIPFTDPVTQTSPVTIGGRVNTGGAVSAAIRYPDGANDPIPLGEQGFFLFEVPAAHLASVHDSDFTLVALAFDGHEVATVDVPAVSPEPAGGIVDTAPITVDTISDGSDFTKVLGVRGQVNVQGAVSLEFTYPDGTTISVRLAADGSYAFDIPTARQSDLLHAPGTLLARDENGHELASVPVASVAFWRAHPSGPGG